MTAVYSLAAHFGEIDVEGENGFLKTTPEAVIARWIEFYNKEPFGSIHTVKVLANGFYELAGLMRQLIATMGGKPNKQPDFDYFLQKARKIKPVVTPTIMTVEEFSKFQRDIERTATRMEGY